MNKIKYLIPILLFPVYLIAVMPVFAENSTDGGSSGRPTPTLYKSDKAAEREEAQEEKKADREEAMEVKKEERMEKRCEQVGERVRAQVAKYSENKDVHVGNYDKVLTKLADIADKMEALGLDVADLRAAITELEGMVLSYANSYAEFIVALESSEDMVCGEEEGDYKDLLKVAREQLKASIELRKEARSYYAHELREVIKELRTQAHTMRSDAREEGALE